MDTRNWFVFVDDDMISCDFETSCIIGYTQDINDTFDWTRHSGTTTTTSTGPRSDHTLGNSKGHYMYTESSEPRRYGDVARLISPRAHTDRGTYSAGFYYSMHGSSMGTLNVYVDIGTGHRSPAFSLTGNQGTSWQYGCVDIPPESIFNVVFESINGVSYFSDMAIDDVTLQTGTCSSMESTTPSGASECQDNPVCPALIKSVPNVCSTPDLASECNGTCLCTTTALPLLQTIYRFPDASECQDNPVCPALIKSVPNVCSTPELAGQCNGTCLCTTTALPLLQTATIYRFPDGSICDDGQACDAVKTTPNFCTEQTLMFYCNKTCGICALYSSGSGSVGGVGGGVASGVVQDHCSQHSCVHGRCVSNTQSYTCSCDIGFMGSLCDNRYLNGTGPVCFNCIYKVDHPSHCGKIKVCSRDEYCGVKKFDGGLYELKCLSQAMCATPEPHTTCTSCCETNVCNTDCKLASECGDNSICPALIKSVPNLCTTPDLAGQCNGTCLCTGNPYGIPGPAPGAIIPSTVSSTLKPITTPTDTPTTTALPLLQTATIHRFPDGSICDDGHACDAVKTTPNFCSEQTLMFYCNKTCGICALYSSDSGSVGGVGGGVASGVVQDHCSQHSCVHGRCVSNTQSYTCSCDLGFMGSLCDNPDPCYSQPCSHGQCEALSSTGGYHCKCDIGFSGLACDIRLVRDCQDVLDYNVPSSTHDDMYLIDITETFMNAKKLNVKCEFSNNIGWTVIMNRNNGQLNFDDKDSAAYATGFGSVRDEFWTGLEYMHFMTSDGRRYQLRIDFTVANGSHYYQIFNDFSVGPHTKFALSVGTSYGTAGDSLSGHNHLGFTTKDRDQDSNSRENCAIYISGGWWFHNCADSCLTCNYVTPGTFDCRSMSWNTLGYCIGLRAVSMKIRPI